jgi:hypothetical protein
LVASQVGLTTVELVKENYKIASANSVKIILDKLTVALIAKNFPPNFVNLLGSLQWQEMP